MKARFFSHHLHGGDPDAERVYRWHIDQRSGHRMRAGVATDRWKRSLDDYTEAARELLASMVQHGFVTDMAIPISIDGEILDGSHRLGCALALGIAMVPVEQKPLKAWAPAWDRDWFLAHGMPPSDMERLDQDFAALAAQ